MHRWLQDLLDLIDTLLKHPSPAKTLLLIVAGLVAGIVALGVTGRIFGADKTGSGRVFFTFLAGMVLMLAAAVATQTHYPAGGAWAMFGAAGAILLAVVLPLTCLALNANYFAAFFGWLIGLGAAAAVIIMLSAGFGAFSSGSEQARKAQSHKQEIEQMLGR